MARTPLLTRLYRKLEIEVRTGRLSRDQAFSLGMVAEKITDNPDGEFAEIMTLMVNAMVLKKDAASVAALAVAGKSPLAREMASLLAREIQAMREDPSHEAPHPLETVLMLREKFKAKVPA